MGFLGSSRRGSKGGVFASLGASAYWGQIVPF